MSYGAFRLYPGEGCQNLGLSLSVADLPEDSRFRNLASAYGAEMTDVPPPPDAEDPLAPRSARELKIEPPIPSERLKEFAAAIAMAALDQDCEPVYFYDHTGEQPKVVLVAK